MMIEILTCGVQNTPIGIFEVGGNDEVSIQVGVGCRVELIRGGGGGGSELGRQWGAPGDDSLLGQGDIFLGAPSRESGGGDDGGSRHR